MDKKWILAIDTCSGHLSLALWHPGTGERQVFKKPMTKGLSETMFPTLQSMLAQQGITMDNIARIAVTHGPGSFTSVRLGLTAAKGFAFALNIPVFSWNTLEILAKQYAKPCAVWLGAHAGNVFVQSFLENGTPVGEPVSMKINEAVESATDTVVGDALLKFPNDIKNFTWENNEAYFAVDPLFLAQQTAELTGDDARKGDTSALYVHPLNYDKTGHTGK